MNSDFFKACAEIKTMETKRIPGKELACLAMLMYGAGIKRRELPMLKVKDVLNKQGEIVDKLVIEDTAINLPPKVKKELQEYADYLLGLNQGHMDPEGPLFPGYSCEKRIYRHLKRHLGTFHNLGRGRVKSLYLQYRKAGAENDEAYEKVAGQFRLTPRRVRDIVLQGKSSYHHQKKLHYPVLQ